MSPQLFRLCDLQVLTHLCFTPSCLLYQTSRHGGADGEALKEASYCITHTERHEFLQRGGDKDTRAGEKAVKITVLLSVVNSVNYFYSPGCCPPCIRVLVQMFFPVK